MQGIQLHDHRARLEGMTANIPGLVFQLQQRADKSLHVLYSSRSLSTLCGECTNADDTAWTGCINNFHPEDRAGFFATMEASAQRLTHWNWEGRITAPACNTKWINLRAMPSVMADGSTIWDGIILNITRSKQRENESLHARELLEKLSGHIQHAREDERTKIAREIHDELGGILTTLKMDLGWLGKRIAHDPALLERTQAMTQLIMEALHTARRIAADLRPAALDNLGLTAAMEEHAAKLLGRRGITYRLTPPEQEFDLDDLHATAIFRIFQESLTNIVRHAAATAVEILLTRSPHGLGVTIRDDGSGITPHRAPSSQSYGILGMQERAKRLGGDLSISSMPGRGTTVCLHIPVASAGNALP
jgi:signal transduction histidine kinase